MKSSRLSALLPEICPLGQICYGWCIISSQWVSIKSSWSRTNLPEIMSISSNIQYSMAEVTSEWGMLIKFTIED